MTKKTNRETIRKNRSSDFFENKVLGGKVAGLQLRIAKLQAADNIFCALSQLHLADLVAFSINPARRRTYPIHNLGIVPSARKTEDAPG
ncbi:MAG: hypothetical protein JO058_16185 [Alphaproteobacteria bacterium]|nr:hypothetical protein [Alphaproteobacteria bacterium]